MAGYGGRRGHLRAGEGDDVECGGDGGSGAAELCGGAEGLSGGCECGGGGGGSGRSQGGFGRAAAVMRERGRLGLRAGRKGGRVGARVGLFLGCGRYGVLRCSDTAARHVCPGTPGPGDKVVGFERIMLLACCRPKQLRDEQPSREGFWGDDRTAGSLNWTTARSKFSNRIQRDS